MTYSDNFLKELNPEQIEAVNYLEGPLLVLAGAGTGKTKVLTSRVANLIHQSKAEPNNILAVTFTNKAAREMSDRINRMISAPGLNIGTFHSIAARILRSHVGYLDTSLSSSFTIIDQDDQIRLIKSIAIDKNIDIKIYPPKLIAVVISRWKDLGLFPHKITDGDAKLPLQKCARLIYEEYQLKLQLSNVVDFGDLLLYNNQLFINSPDLLKYYQNKFQYILIDEYQDTNAVQYVWARMLASLTKNICCVGDDDQSIYSWRGAEVGNILRFEKDFTNAKIIKLEQNYRSSSEILAAASGLIRNNKQRHGKMLWTARTAGEKLKVISCWNDKEEARFVVSEIERMITQGNYRANQIAILVRAGFQTRAFEEVFISNALPYKIIGGLKFYERMEIRDLLAYIRVSLNFEDNLALERIINTPKRSIGDSTLKLIKDYANDNHLQIFEAINEMLKNGQLKSKARDSLEKLVHLINNWQIRYKSESAFEVTKSILEESGYLDALKLEKSEEARGRIENLNEMLRAINEFGNIEEFIQHTSLVMENDSLESNFGGAVNVMTLHAAKGLEFELVFLPGWEEGIFPHQKAINEEGEKGLEEERRIAYVGITRAKKELYISYAESRWMFNEVLNSLPSRFLAEIPDEVHEKISSSKKLNYMGSKHNFSFQSNSKPIVPQIKLKFEGDEMRPGARVKHEKFGVGIITKRSEDNLEIVFEGGGGIRTIKKAFVQLA